MAIGHAKTCIRLNYKHIPSWHLLAILTVASSDRGFSEYEIAMKALRVCTTAAEALASGRNISAKRLRDLDIYLSPGNKEEWLKYVGLSVDGLSISCVQLHFTRMSTVSR